MSTYFQFKFKFSAVGQSKTKLRLPVPEFVKASDSSGLKYSKNPDLAVGLSGAS